MLDIQHYKIGVLHELLPLGIKPGSCLRVGSAAGIQGGMDACCLCLPEKLCEKVDLEQRFSAADRDSALVSPVIAVAERLFKKLVRTCRGLPLSQLPGVRIVAELAAHGTAA